MARSMQLPLSIVGRPTNLGPPQTSFHMTSFFRRPSFNLYCDVSNVARETLQTWQDGRFRHGKTDVSNVAREMLQTWQERCYKRGKTEVSNVASETLRTWQDQRLPKSLSSRFFSTQALGFKKKMGIFLTIESKYALSHGIHSYETRSSNILSFGSKPYL
jgi:hypothetical protein